MNFIYRTWNFIVEKLYALSLRQMNFGRASSYRTNGELHSLKQLAKRWADQPVTLFDVGANVGEYTIEILEAFHNRPFKLYIFEPSSKAWAQLRKRVPEATNIHAVQMAVGHEEGKADLYFPEEGSALASLLQRDLEHMDVSFEKREQVKITTLDIFCRDHSVEQINLLKLDVEGNELNVLKGASGLLGRNAIEVIQFEFGGTNIDSRTYFKDFFQLLSPKFSLYRILPAGLREIPVYTEKLEIFQAANYVAIRRP